MIVIKTSEYEYKLFTNRYFINRKGQYINVYVENIKEKDNTTSYKLYLYTFYFKDIVSISINGKEIKL